MRLALHMTALHGSKARFCEDRDDDDDDDDDDDAHSESGGTSGHYSDSSDSSGGAGADGQFSYKSGCHAHAQSNSKQHGWQRQERRGRERMQEQYGMWRSSL